MLVSVGVGVSVFVGVVVEVTVGVAVGVGVAVAVGDGDGVAVSVGIGVGQGVAAKAANTGILPGECHARTSSIPKARAAREASAIVGTNRSHPLPGVRCSDSSAEVADDGASLTCERAHWCAARARALSGSRARARSAYARPARGLSLSHVIHNRAATLAGSRAKITRNMRRASPFWPFRAATSPSLSSAVMRWSIGKCSVKGYWRWLDARLRPSLPSERIAVNRRASADV